MKLLVVTQYFFPENFRVNDLVNGMVARGHQITVLTAQPNYPEGRFHEGYGWRGPRHEHLLGAEVFRVPLLARGNGNALRLILNYLSFAWFGSFAARFRLKGTFDAVFVFEPSPVTVGIPALIACHRFNAPVLFWVLDLWPESLSATGAIRSPGLLRFVGKGVRWIYLRCARILVQSRAFVPNVEAFGVSPSRIKYFPNWVESEYEACSAYGEMSEDENSCGEFRVVFAGNIGQAQDFPAILDAAECVAKAAPAVRWVIAGEGRMAPWVRAEVTRRGLVGQFEFLGQLPSEKMPAVFSRADILLVSLRPDPVFSLTIPGKVQSYLSAGKPVVGMLDGEGARVIEESGGGLSCPAGDSNGLSALVLRLAGYSPGQRAEMGRLGREYAKREFGRDRLFDRLEEWFSEAIAENKSKG